MGTIPFVSVNQRVTMVGMAVRVGRGGALLTSPRSQSSGGTAGIVGKPAVAVWVMDLAWVETSGRKCGSAIWATAGRFLEKSNRRFACCVQRALDSTSRMAVSKEERV